MDGDLPTEDFHLISSCPCWAYTNIDRINMLTDPLLVDIDSIDISHQYLSDVFLCKIFQVLHAKNEWGGWYGNTGIVKREVQFFYMNPRDAKKYAESRRISGTYFEIYEEPAVCCVGDTQSLIVTNIFNKRLVGKYLRSINDSKKIYLYEISCCEELQSIIYKDTQIGARGIYIETKDKYFRYISEPDPKRSHLKWNHSRYQPDLSDFKYLVRQLKNRITSKIE